MKQQTKSQPGKH